MNRSTVLSAIALAALLSLVGLIAVGPALQDTSAQEAATQGHPLVGTWLADTDPENETNGLDLFTFSSDGTYVDVEADGSSQLGAWEATGPTSAILTIVAYEGDDDGNYFGSITIRASIEVSADGASFTAQYTIELTNPDGTSSGEAGPGTATGTRLVVEAPGTPVMTIEEMSSGIDDFDGVPEATPAA